MAIEFRGFMIKEFAPAKVNLFLDVIRKREDGYHDLGTVFQTVGVGDYLSGEANCTGEITVGYNVPQEYPLEKDLVYKAAMLLKQTYNVSQGANFYMEKIMPLGAGLGGGSADAAAALRILNKIWNLSLSYEELEKLGAKLGADVPFLVQGGTAFAEGIGDVLKPCTVEFPKSVLIATPHAAVPTKDAYGGIVPSGDSRWENFKKNYTGKLDFELYNKFEESVLPKYPKIVELKKAMQESGALQVLMSGSGASVFAIYDSESAAERAKEIVSPISRYVAVTEFVKSAV